MSIIAYIRHLLFGGANEYSNADLARQASEHYNGFVECMTKLNAQLLKDKAAMDTVQSDMVDAHKYIASLATQTQAASAA
jgi:hypothetical protein